MNNETCHYHIMHNVISNVALCIMRLLMSQFANWLLFLHACVHAAGRGVCACSPHAPLRGGRLCAHPISLRNGGSLAPYATTTLHCHFQHYSPLFLQHRELHLHRELHNKPFFLHEHLLFEQSPLHSHCQCTIPWPPVGEAALAKAC